jgi:hypothetical protein
LVKSGKGATVWGPTIAWTLFCAPAAALTELAAAAFAAAWAAPLALALDAEFAATLAAALAELAAAAFAAAWAAPLALAFDAELAALAAALEAGAAAELAAAFAAPLAEFAAAAFAAAWAAPLALALEAEAAWEAEFAAELEAAADCETLARRAALKPLGTTTICGGFAAAEAAPRQLVASTAIVNSRISAPR